MAIHQGDLIVAVTDADDARGVLFLPFADEAAAEAVAASLDAEVRVDHPLTSTEDAIRESRELMGHADRLLREADRLLEETDAPLSR